MSTDRIYELVAEMTNRRRFLGKLGAAALSSFGIVLGLSTNAFACCYDYACCHLCQPAGPRVATGPVVIARGAGLVCKADAPTNAVSATSSRPPALRIASPSRILGTQTWDAAVPRSRANPLECQAKLRSARSQELATTPNDSLKTAYGPGL